MTVFDYIVIGIISFSALLSITRGLVHEIVSLLAWIIAFFAASRYSVNVAPLLAGMIENESIRMLVAFSATFFHRSPDHDAGVQTAVRTGEGSGARSDRQDAGGTIRDDSRAGDRIVSDNSGRFYATAATALLETGGTERTSGSNDSRYHSLVTSGFQKSHWLRQKQLTFMS